MKIKRINLFWIMVNLVFIVFIFDMVINTIKIRKDISKLKLEEKQEAEEITILENRKKELKYNIENIDAEKIAREKLNMVKDGERIYKLIE